MVYTSAYELSEKWKGKKLYVFFLMYSIGDSVECELLWWIDYALFWYCWWCLSQYLGVKDMQTQLIYRIKPINIILKYSA